MTEEWEQSFLPLDDPHAVKPPRVTQCANCDELVHGDLVIVKVFHTGHGTEQEHFCQQACVEDWYLRRLREEHL